MDRRLGHGPVTLGLGLLIAAALLVSLGSVATATGSGAGAEDVTLYATEDPEYENVRDVEAAIENDSLGHASRMVVGETLVVEIQSERLGNDMAERNGTTTERFFAATDDETTFTLYQTNPTAEIPPKVLHVGPENTTVYRNGSRTYVAIRTGTLSIGYDPPQDDSVPEPDIHRGETFAVTFGYGVEDPTRGPEIEFQQIEAELFGTLDPLAPEVVNRTIAVRIRPETNVTVRATLEDGTTITDEPSAVSWSGFDHVALDLRGVAPGTNYTLEVIHDGDVVDRRNGTVRDPEAALADPVIVETDERGIAARLLVNASLSHGGLVVVEDETGQVVGTKRVAPGEEIRPSIPLIPRDEAVESFEADELQLQAVRETPPGETAYGDSEAQLTIDGSDFDWETDSTTTTTTTTSTATSTTPASTTTSTTPTTTSTGNHTTTGDGATTTTDTTVPGFGVGSALVGFGAMVSLLRRRRSQR